MRGVLLPGVPCVGPVPFIDQRVHLNGTAAQRGDEVEVRTVEVVALRGGHEHRREPAVEPLDRGHEAGGGAQHDPVTALGQQHSQKVEAEHEAALEHHRDVGDAAVLHQPPQVSPLHLRTDVVVGGQHRVESRRGQQGGDVAAGGIPAEHDPAGIPAEILDVAGHPAQNLVAVVQHVGELETCRHPVVRVDDDHAVDRLAGRVFGERGLVARGPATAVEIHVDRQRPRRLVRHQHVEAMVTDAVAHVVKVEVVIDGVDGLRVEPVALAGRDPVHQRAPCPDGDAGEAGFLVLAAIRRAAHGAVLQIWFTREL